MLRSLIVGCLFFLLLNNSAYAMRCNGEIVLLGDKPEIVMEKCGKPSEKHIVKEKVKLPSGKVKVSTTRVWTYNFGSTDFLYELYFTEGKVHEIKAVGYGYSQNKKLRS